MPRSSSSNVYVQILIQQNLQSYWHLQIPKLVAYSPTPCSHISLFKIHIYILVHWPKRFVNWIHSWHSRVSIIQLFHSQYFIPYLPKRSNGRVCLLFSYPTIFAIIKDYHFPTNLPILAHLLLHAKLLSTCYFQLCGMLPHSMM
jgi:hypothetical protein